MVTIAVDIQNDFCPGGSLAVTNGDQIIDPMNKLMRYTRLHNGLVVATGDQHPPITPHFGENAWPVHCVAGTHGAEFHPDLELLPEDEIIDKGMGQTDGYSGFEGITEAGFTIESFITPSRRERVAVNIGGLATDFCVLQTALDALRIDAKDGYIGVYIAEDAVRGVNLQPDDSKNALGAMQDAGAIITTTEEILTQAAYRLAA
jgi:nicotinamidase/pyrazinamidase